MGTMKANVVLVTLAVYFGSVAYTQACSCMAAHPQEHYCNSDFVILARIKRKITDQSTYTDIYKVRVRQEFKISEKGLVALKSGRLITPSSSSMCGVDLEIGKLYVISGNIFSLRAHFGLCNMVQKWEHLSKRQRKGLKRMYKLGCDCGIRLCFGHRCTRQKDSCNWRNQCELREGICHRQANGSCLWNRNKALTTCNKEWRSNNTLHHTIPGF